MGLNRYLTYHSGLVCCGRNMRGEYYFMDCIRAFTLLNLSSFYVRLSFVYLDSYGNMYQGSSSENIAIGRSATLNPGDYGVPEGATVSLYVTGSFSTDEVAPQQFVYRRSCQNVASYTIRGRAYDSELTYNGFESSGGSCSGCGCNSGCGSCCSCCQCTPCCCVIETEVTPAVSYKVTCLPTNDNYDTGCGGSSSSGTGSSSSCGRTSSSCGCGCSGITPARSRCGSNSGCGCGNTGYYYL